MKKLKLRLGEGLRDLFRSEELDQIEPEPRQHRHWLRRLLSSEPLDDLAEERHEHQSLLRWLLSSETLSDLPPDELRASRLRWLLSSETLGDLPEPETPRASLFRHRPARAEPDDSPAKPQAGKAPGTGDQS